MTTPLEARLLELVSERGPLRFDDYMSLALYDPEAGYYGAGAERTSWSGHFITSPQLDPAYGELWGGAIARIHAASGSPDRFHVVEIGPGEGGFASALLDHLGAEAPWLSYHLIEPLPRLAERQHALLERHLDALDVAWHDTLQAIGTLPHGCVFANEVLDNLPVRVVERREGALLELFVGARDGALVEITQPLRDPIVVEHLQRADVSVADGSRFEVQLEAETLLRNAARSIECGAVAIVDYGAEARTLAERPSGSLVCYSATGTDDYALDRPGAKDITVHADWTTTRRALTDEGFVVAGPVPQRRVLANLGLAAIDERLRAEHDAALADKRGADAIRALSRRQALGALRDPGGLGSLDVVLAARGVPVPDFMRA